MHTLTRTRGGTTWQWKRSRRSPYWLLRWQHAEHTSDTLCVVDDFGDLAFVG